MSYTSYGSSYTTDEWDIADDVERCDSQWEVHSEFARDGVVVRLADADDAVLEEEIARLEEQLRRGFRVIPKPVQYDVEVEKVRVRVNKGASYSSRKKAIRDYMRRQTEWEPAVMHRAYKLWCDNARHVYDDVSDEGRSKSKKKSKGSKKSMSSKKKSKSSKKSKSKSKGKKAKTKTK
ncbi:uncharacterized protein AMSG_08853 [Thecamonas trahens ATCC 50062]|uniref:Uncharacterized protein n=1 Tax=Thecamonas trahens ATCC 50062 TaxID=461836 RepID=A0A0L0DMT8_THETB|nr:hypothetical protein AMSG_08853 [Thecamonas trahens ATCC 50062]KNC53351.1 hypothetical protein AMSG_08853 [Thecamonas trahens ATCC 50062]|eukprot:XP_013754399.1 hypothetical protein AMSG_08853 [Thecamonas trahens ATCC 50062]